MTLEQVDGLRPQVLELGLIPQRRGPSAAVLAAAVRHVALFLWLFSEPHQEPPGPTLHFLQSGQDSLLNLGRSFSPLCF